MSTVCLPKKTAEVTEMCTNPSRTSAGGKDAGLYRGPLPLLQRTPQGRKQENMGRIQNGSKNPE